MTRTEKRALEAAQKLPKHDVLWKLADLHKQATTERSHYYTGTVVTILREDLPDTRTNEHG